MIVEMSPHEVAGTPEAEVRTASVSAYVDLPLADVFARFSDPGIDGLLMATMRRSLSGGGEVLSVHTWPTLWVATGTVRVQVTWRIRRADAVVREGTASISLLMVQGGQDAITELLVTVPLGEDDAAMVAEATHHILDELTRRLERRAG